MLRRFLYLDTVALSQYVTALEGGIVTESTKRSMRSGSGSGGFDAKLLQVSGEKGREEEESKLISDTDEARFARLLQAAEAEPDALAWVEVMNADHDFRGIGIGAMVSWECDLYIPDIIKAMARSGEAHKAIEMMQNVLPMARRLGLDMEGLPDDDEISAAAGFLDSINASIIVVGEDDETDWRIAAELDNNFVHGDVEGRARLVGKVAKMVKPGRWKPYLAFPGMNLLPREERRQKERQGPEPGKENEYLPGPALMLDLLAIYR